MPMNYDKFFARIKDKSKNNGVNTSTLRKNGQISESTLQRMRRNEPINTDVICRLCYLMKCTPSAIMEYIPDESDMSRPTA